MEQYNKGVACDNTNDQSDTNVFSNVNQNASRALCIGILNKKVKEHDAENV